MFMLFFIPILFFTIFWVIFYTFIKAGNQTVRIVVSGVLALVITGLLCYGVWSRIGY